ncbi:MAG: hypothetical protein R6X02_15635 [Enhygromyxa sp.]
MRRAWLLAGLIVIAPGSARAAEPAEVDDPVADEDHKGAQATRLEFGVALGDYLLAIGSPSQLHYAPALDLRLAYGLTRIEALGFVRLAAPLQIGDSIAIEQRQLSTGGGLGLRSIFVQRRFVRFGLWLAGTLDRLDSSTRLPALPGLDEPGHVQKRVTHHAGTELGLELGVPLPLRRGPTTVLTLGAALSFVFPIGSSRSGSDVADARYQPSELGVIGPAGGATALVNLGVMLGWDFARLHAL